MSNLDTYSHIRIQCLSLNLLKSRNQATSPDVLQLISSLQRENQELKNQLVRIESEISSIKKQNLLNIQKIGFLRFNPFEETGGDQSFVIALLDGANNGFVITSLHSRGGTRTYAKPVEQGKSSYELSKDEQKAIIKAIGNEKQ